jgi:AAA15 family ATPase/GTPase
MIINFHIENFGSIKKRQTLSFEADKSKHLEDYYIIPAPGGRRLLKMALIYGANASGKTSVLKALDFLRSLVLNPQVKKTDTLNFEPFLFDPHTPQQPTVLAIEFIQGEHEYFYEVVFTKTAVLKEVLKQAGKKIFSRSTDIEKQYASIEFAKGTGVGKAAKEALEANTLWNNTVLGGFLKTNLQTEALNDVSVWFNSKLGNIILPHTDLTGFVTENIQKGPELKSTLLAVLKHADFNVTDFIIEERETKDIPSHIVQQVKEKVAIHGLDEKVALESLSVSFVKLDLVHSVGDRAYNLSMIDESHGTQRYYGLSGLLAFLLKFSIILPIDELESSLHPDLYKHFLLTFLSNAKQSQLIATTHNRELMDNRDLFRNDAIWFTQKGEAAATELYSLADFDTSVVRDTSNVLNAYKAGKLGAVPQLGDYYIDLDSEKK